MSALLAGLTRRAGPVGRAAWGCFLDRLSRGRLARGEAAAVLASLSTVMPDPGSLAALFDAAQERGGAEPVAYPGAVNVVGTGGGPLTVNVSTAAAVVAAAMGVRVVKTGSRGYSRRAGSFDVLAAAGVPLAGSHSELADMVDRFGVGFAGVFVYPVEISLLAAEIVPLDLRTVGRFVNTVGPFLAQVSVAAQLTGVARAEDVPALRALAARRSDQKTWLCHNDTGVDELVSFAVNHVHEGVTGRSWRLEPSEPGSLLDLAPGADPVADLRALLSGSAPIAAVQTVCLNAAALAVLSGSSTDWARAKADAAEVVRDGAATALLARLVRHG
ncbi:anthranilate phosphoribosyltransferase [Actinokineospora baliensis]|uniref:hypothetical protein n=1 Tax=Actinokineospora baliensis TaxID=547056 RepID=UPI001958ABCC|nr:hypothetical protein [Actinokineospora baliensis]MBM7773749.1 anthranilate phosphoribosyltransferase [Actinokineospora baliensis]